MNQSNSDLIFICYTRKDLPYAETIERSLREHSHRLWRDKSSLLGGEHWLKEIISTIERASAALVLLGKHGRGEFQKYEISILIPEHLKENRKLRLIPVVLPGYSDSSLPTELSPFQSVDLMESFHDENCILSNEGLVRLRRSIHGRYPEEEPMQSKEDPQKNPLLLFLKSLSQSRSSLVASTVLEACRNLKTNEIRDDLKLDENAEKDLLFADDCIQSANSFSNDPLARDDALKAFVIVGSFLGSVLRPSARSEQLAWEAVAAILAEAKLELWVSPSKQSEIVRLFFEPRLYFQDDDLLVELRGLKMTRIAEN